MPAPVSQFAMVAGVTVSLANATIGDAWPAAAGTASHNAPGEPAGHSASTVNGPTGP